MSLARARNIADLRALARARLPRMVFDYIDGGADDERTLAANEARLKALELSWDALVDVSSVDPSTTIMGEAMTLPFFISPTATSRLFNPRAGELAVAAAAEAAGVVYACSTLATTSMEAIAAAHRGPRWFQVYVWKDRALVRETLARAEAAGFSAIILTVDLPVAGNRERDHANDFTIPPKSPGARPRKRWRGLAIFGIWRPRRASRPRTSRTSTLAAASSISSTPNSIAP